MNWKQWREDYFNFSRKDSIAILLIISLIAGVFFLPVVVTKSQTPAPATDTAWVSAMNSLVQKENADRTDYPQQEENDGTFSIEKNNNFQKSTPGHELFYFDPNTISAGDWRKLGLRDKTIHTILNYVSKGGQFRKPEDLQRIYGLFPDEYARIAPYIQIEGKSANPAENFPDNKAVVREPVFSKSNGNRYTIIDINTADTTALLPLPGIGSKLATRILTFRDKLGGFYSISQVSETFGLPDSTFQKIKPYLRVEPGAVKKININTATIDELKAHPYIRWAVANPLIAYRNEHGPFAGITDLKKVMAVTDAIYSKLEPYITVK